jgi:hypothetical protein
MEYETATSPLNINRDYRLLSVGHNHLTINDIFTPWHESTSELYRPNDRRFSAKLMRTFEDRGCHVVSATDLYCRILGFLDRSSYFFSQLAPQLYSRAEWTPYQNHYFSKNLVTPGI